MSTNQNAENAQSGGGGWLAQRLVYGEVHVTPLGDSINHAPNDCICGPETEPCPRDDGSMGWLITHHSLDGREFNRG